LYPDNFAVIIRFFGWLERTTDPLPTLQPEMPPASLIPFILHYAKPFWRLLLTSALFTTVIALLEVSLFAFLGRLVDWLVTSTRATFWDDHGRQLMIMGAVVLVILPILKFFYEAVSHQGLLGNFAMRTRWQAHRYLLRQSMEFYQDDFAGRVATKMMQTALAVRDIVMKLTEVLLYVAVYFTAAVVLFASSDLRLTAPMIIWFFGYMVAMRFFVPRLRDWSKAQAEARSVVTGRVVDSYTNISTVKMFAHAAYEDGYAREGMQAFLEPVYGQMRLSTLLIVTLNIMNACLIFSIAGMSVWLWYLDAVGAGAIALATGLVLRLQGMSQWIMWEVSTVFENIGVVMDGVETIARERAIDDAPGARALVVDAGGIRYDHIHFNYGAAREDVDQGVIVGLDLHIRPGEKVGIVGRSGAGKSTLVSLLLRLYDLEDGRILIDGQDISAVTQDSLRAQIGMVTQDTSLLHRSVFDNISYSKPGATEAQVLAAAKAAKADNFIAGLKDGQGRRGLAAHVGERGVKLSGGQRQRIAIARVLLKDAPILILDEATSALDSEVEAAIQDNFQALMVGKTVIAIAHRLSTIAAMDRLIVMDQGRIVEEGDHEALLLQDGLYAGLWSHQSGGFLALRHQ
jgi:ATP-binding cassette subfamily B multidrug efflux pump